MKKILIVFFLFGSISAYAQKQPSGDSAMLPGKMREFADLKLSKEQKTAIYKALRETVHHNPPMHPPFGGRPEDRYFDKERAPFPHERQKPDSMDKDFGKKDVMKMHHGDHPADSTGPEFRPDGANDRMRGDVPEFSGRKPSDADSLHRWQPQPPRRRERPLGRHREFASLHREKEKLEFEIKLQTILSKEQYGQYLKDQLKRFEKL